MVNVNDLKKRKSERKLAAEKLINAAMQAGTDLKGAELTEYDGHIAEIKNIDAMLTRHAELATFSTDTQTEPGIVIHARGEEDVENKPLAALATKEYKSGFMSYLRKGQNASREVMAALNIATPGQGGYGVPLEFDTQIVEKLINANVMRQIAQVITTTSDRNILVENNVGAADWAAEQATAYNDNAADDDSFSQKLLKSYKLTRVEKVSEELLMDNFFDLQGWLARKFANAFGLAEEAAFVNGVGSTRPTGVVQGSTAGITAHLHNDIATDELFDFYHSLRRAYRTNASFLLNDSTALMLRKKKDGQGRYIWQPGLTAGQPDQLLGRPAYVSDFMPTADNAGNKAVLFGDFSYYTIGDRAPRTFVRLNELYIANGLVGFRGIQRTDGLLTLGDSVKYLAMGAAS